MIRFFRSGNPLTVLLLLIYTIVLKFNYLIHPQAYVSEKSEGLFYDMFVQFLDGVANKNAFFYTFFAVALIFVQALLLTRIINNQRLFSKPTYLPAMCYILFTSLFTSWNVFSPALLVNTIMLWVFANITQLYNRTSARDVAFNLGFAVGICGLIYFPSIIFVLLIFVSLLIMRSFRLAEWIIALLGLACPLYLFGTYLFLTDQWGLMAKVLRIGLPLPLITDYKVWGAMITSVLFFVLGWLLLQTTFKKMLIQGRKIWSAAAVYVIVAMVIPFFTVNFAPLYWLMAILPVSMFAGNVFWSIRSNTFANIVHFVVLGYVIVMQYFTH
ncbi:hypothetical protein LX64_03104 [Chitinophaga skermanii]|uniref:Beta-carotene 15,15'-monooxygenase n=1 Tax=Chitinophaga skermanii TaxID=331697 RepID=A0A327QK21_9BACT|nr:hypothetical protein [Chitinophaga skermanii]RAJ04225.1 hypothetical protein LX64_03104 [Chitinophaga skermanii]